MIQRAVPSGAAIRPSRVAASLSTTQGRPGAAVLQVGGQQLGDLVAGHARRRPRSRPRRSSVHPPARDPGVGVEHADHHPGHPGGHDGLGAGRGPALVGAGLEGGVEGGAGGPVPGGGRATTSAWGPPGGSVAPSKQSPPDGRARHRPRDWGRCGSGPTPPGPAPGAWRRDPRPGRAPRVAPGRPWSWARVVCVMGPWQSTGVNAGHLGCLPRRPGTGTPLTSNPTVRGVSRRIPSGEVRERRPRTGAMSVGSRGRPVEGPAQRQPRGIRLGDVRHRRGRIGDPAAGEHRRQLPCWGR